MGSLPSDSASNPLSSTPSTVHWGATRYPYVGKNGQQAKPLTLYQKTLIETAARRWEQVIVGDLPDVHSISLFDLADLNIDDILIEVFVGDKSMIHPDEGWLAKADSTMFGWLRAYVTQGTGLPFYGIVELNPWYLDEMTYSDTLFDTMLHEIGHSLGFNAGFIQAPYLDNRGNIVYPHNYFVEPAPGDFAWAGPAALAEYRLLVRDPESPGVPVEIFGDPSQLFYHWRELSVMGLEIMSTVADNTVSLSRVTAGFMIDLGYVVNLDAADPYYIG
jgi:hypothetical protein